MYSTIFKNAIINLYRANIYTVDYAILRATDYADKNKINADDYLEIMTFFITEQSKQLEESILTTEAEQEIAQIEELQPEQPIVEENVITE